ncbi:MAG TPA: hypothetical protein VFG88_00370 [Nocardioidaceae bacterium]|nr:hypothetical protein [Nocardioidaceae bacterium]
MSHHVTARRRSGWERFAAVVGVMLLLATLPFYAASGLVAPLWAIVLLLAFWLWLLVMCVRWWRAHPLRVLTAPLLAVLVWYAALTLGETVLGWTA